MKEKEFLPLVIEKLSIDSLNPMQIKMMAAASEHRDIILLSPTGSGKTLAFILPMLKILRPSTGRVQAIVIAPSRELVIQIARIVSAIASGFKISVLYGGHKVEDEVNSLSVTPDVIVATPGRLLDHIRRRNIDVLPTRILVLDEFDKSLELGFEEDMAKIVGKLKNVSRTMLTSATKADTLPDFIRLTDPLVLDFSNECDMPRNRMNIMRVNSSGRDKLESLRALLSAIVDRKPGDKVIVFVNYRESAERVAEFLRKEGADVVLYHGALKQIERESAVALFNNGSRPILVATDLASRGLDISGVGAVVHYHQPLTPEAFTHRNGRTARVDAFGDVYILIGPDEDVKPFVEFDSTFIPDESVRTPLCSGLLSLFISAGKKEKLSKGDILGFLIKEGGLDASQIGRIDVFDHHAIVAVARDVVDNLLPNVENKKIKGEKRKISVIITKR